MFFKLLRVPRFASNCLNYQRTRSHHRRMSCEKFTERTCDQPKVPVLYHALKRNTSYFVPLSKSEKLDWWRPSPINGRNYDILTFFMVFMPFTIIFLTLANCLNDQVHKVYINRLVESIISALGLPNNTIHELVSNNQRYNSWPNMQDAMDFIRAAKAVKEHEESDWECWDANSNWVKLASMEL